MFIRETINFQRGIQPKEAMKTGAEAELHDYALRFFDEENIDNNLDEILDHVLNDSELDNDVQKTYITLLLQKIPLNNLTEDNVINLHDKDINLVPFLKKQPRQQLGGSFELLIKNNIYYVTCGDWIDFTEIMKYNNRDISEKFVEDVLQGDAYEYFTSDHYYDTYDKDFDVSLQKDLSEYQELYDEAKKIDPSFNVENTNQLFSLIWELADEDDNFEKLKHAIIKAYAETEESANEYEAFKHITNTVMNNFGMTYDKKNSGQTLLFEISESGLNSLIYALLYRDYRCEYKLPQGGDYYGDWDETIFIECLDSNIDWITK